LILGKDIVDVSSCLESCKGLFTFKLFGPADSLTVDEGEEAADPLGVYTFGGTDSTEVSRWFSTVTSALNYALVQHWSLSWKQALEVNVLHIRLHCHVAQPLHPASYFLSL
jgi:hypothetical protein